MSGSSTGAFRVRPRDGRDLPALIDIVQRTQADNQGSYPYTDISPDAMGDWLLAAGSLAWIAESASSIPLGQVALVSEPYGMLAGFGALAGEISRLLVDPSARGQGVATALVQHVRAQQPTAPHGLWVLDVNTAAIGLWHSLGATLVGHGVSARSRRPMSAYILPALHRT